MKNEKVKIGEYYIDAKFVLPKNTKEICTIKGCKEKAVYQNKRMVFDNRKNKKYPRTDNKCFHHFKEHKNWFVKNGKESRKKTDKRSAEIIKGLSTKYFEDLKVCEEKGRYILMNLFQKSNLFVINEFLLSVDDRYVNRNMFRADIYIPSLKLFIEAKKNSTTCTPGRYKTQMEMYRKIINKKFPISQIVSYDIDGSSNADYNFLDFFKFLKNKVLKSKMVKCDKKVFEKEVNRIIKVLESRKDLFIYR